MTRHQDPVTRDCALASQVLSAVGDWACGDGTPTDDVSPYRDVTRAVFDGLSWLEDQQPAEAMVARAGIKTRNPLGPDVHVQVFFDLDPTAGARIAFQRGDGSSPAARITDHVAACLAASLTVTPTDTVRPPYMPGNELDLITFGTALHLGGSLTAAYRRLVDADTTFVRDVQPEALFEARAFRGSPDDPDLAAAAIRRLSVPDGWTAEPSLRWIRRGDSR